MKSMKLILVIIFQFGLQSLFAQVGIGNTNPQATLDISASSTSAPSNTDGILIPRMANFPSSPTANQDGMLIFYTGTALSGKGFYYWDDTATNWVFLASGGKNTLGLAYNEGGSGVGRTINATDGAVRINGGDGFLVTGTSNSGNTIDSEITGAGTRMFFNPRKAAFRAGEIDSNQWDDGNIGLSSFASGANTTASGNYSTALGYYSQATNIYSTAIGFSANAIGDYSIALGTGIEASGDYSIATGYFTDATGDYSTALGVETLASGYSSTAMGYNTEASSFAETSIGYYNSIYTPLGITSANTVDRVFSIGNGIDDSNRSNALIIYKNGLMNINDEYNMPLIDGTANQIMATDGNDNVTFVDASTLFTDTNTTYNGTDFALSNQTLPVGQVVTGISAAGTLIGTPAGTDNQNISGSGLSGTDLTIGIQNGTSEVIDLSPLGNTLDQAYDQGAPGAGSTIDATDGAVTVAGEDGILVTGTFGSGDDVLISSTGTRLFFNPKKAAFRTGYINGVQWDNANVGDYSTAFGRNTTASGVRSTAMGNGATASGGNSIAMGNDATASGGNSIAMGDVATASGGSSTSIGAFTIASSSFSTALGNRSNASGHSSVAMGYYTDATSNNSTAMGNTTEASGVNSTAMGNSTVASATNSTAMGNSTEASGANSTAMGSTTIASGDYSTVMGRHTEAPSYAETSIGYYNLAYTPINSSSANNADRLFTIGNGTPGTRSNALTIYKSGLININDEYDMPLIDGTANQIMSTDGSGHVSFVDASSVFTDTDNQDLSLTSNILSLTNDGTSVDLTTYLDNTDNQNISGSGLSGTDLTIGIQNGTSETVDLSSLQDGTGTDNQNISGSGLSGTDLTIGIQNGTSEVIDLSSLNTGGDITAVTAGDGLTGGGTTGTVTLDVAATNGINATTNDIRLGGTLIQDTNIDYGNFDTRFNLDGTGDFIIQDTGSGVFTVNDAGNSIVGRNMTWRESSIVGTIIGQMLTDGTNDGRFTVCENGSIAVDLRANTEFIFNQQGADRDFRVESDGNQNMLLVNAGSNSVGIGGNPDTDLHTFHNDTAASAGLKLQNQGANNNWWRMFTSNANGNLYIYSTNGGATPRGNFNDATGVYSATSDRRLKKDFKPLPFSWQNFMNLETLSYLYKAQKDDKRSLGLIAQDVELIYPELVTYNIENDVYHLNYSGFGVIAIKAVQELKAEVDTLKQENAELKAKLNQLEVIEARLSALESTSKTSAKKALVSIKED